MKMRIVLMTLLCGLVPVLCHAQAEVLRDNLGSAQMRDSGEKKAVKGYYEFKCFQEGKLIFNEHLGELPRENRMEGFISFRGVSDTGKDVQIIISPGTACVVEQF